MKRTNNTVKVLGAVLPSILLAGCASAASSESPALISSVEQYRIDYETGEWTLNSRTTYAYQDAYPVSKTFSEILADHETVTIFEYDLQDGVPQKMKQYDSDGTQSGETIYKENGVIDRRKSFSADHLYEQEQVYQYGLDDAYFTMVLHESANRGSSDFTEHMEEVDSVVLTEQNGLLQKTVNNGLYANWDDKEQPKEWMRFNGTYTAEYDSDGIVSDTSAVYRAGPSGKELKFEVKRENGRVTEAIRYRCNGTDGWIEDEKTVFEYTDIAVSKSRYASMINAFLLGESSTYYIFNWY